MRLLYAARVRSEVERWSQRFSLCDDPDTVVAENEFLLRYLDGQLSLHKGSDPVGIRVDERDIARRGRGKFALAQACGDPMHGSRSIFDATAGLGTDLLALRARGYQLHGMEMNPVLLSMLESYLEARGISDVTLRLGDAVVFLGAEGSGCYDVIYLDPMFPETGKTALPGKHMQYLRELLGDAGVATDDPAAMLKVARMAANDRVVLKRRRRDPLIDQPDWQIKGRSVRYDVYRALK